MDVAERIKELSALLGQELENLLFQFVFDGLCRRSQRKRLTWERFADLLRDFPLPRPRITVRIWGT